MEVTETPPSAEETSNISERRESLTSWERGRQIPDDLPEERGEGGSQYSELEAYIGRFPESEFGPDRAAIKALFRGEFSGEDYESGELPDQVNEFVPWYDAVMAIEGNDVWTASTISTEMEKAIRRVPQERAVDPDFTYTIPDASWQYIRSN
jgi:hypothetical protein